MLNRIFSVIFLLSSCSAAQIYLSAAGGSAGFANFSGLSARQTGFLLMPSFEAGFKGTPGYFLSASFFSIRNTGILIPEIREGKYYGSLLGVSAGLQIRQPVTPSLYIQGSGGPAYIFDKSTPGVELWSAGLAFGVSAGLDLKSAGLSRSRFRVTAGFTAAFTLHNTFPGYQAAVIGFFIPISD